MFRNQFRQIWTFALAAVVAGSVGLVPGATAAAQTIVGPPPTALPDLTIVYGGSPRAVMTHVFDFRMQLKNIGGAPTPIGQKARFTTWLPNGFLIESITAPAGVTCQFNNQGQPIPLDPLRPVAGCSVNAPMLAGSDVKVEMRVRTPSQPGQHSFSLFADLAYEMHEARENNNILGVTFQVL